MGHSSRSHRGSATWVVSTLLCCLLSVLYSGETNTGMSVDIESCRVSLATLATHMIPAIALFRWISFGSIWGWLPPQPHPPRRPERTSLGNAAHAQMPSETTQKRRQHGIPHTLSSRRSALRVWYHRDKEGLPTFCRSAPLLTLRRIAYEAKGWACER